MVDASKGFVKDGNKNRLREQDIHKIVTAFNEREEIPGFSRMVPLDEIANPINGFNLNIPRYIDSIEPEDLHDLDAHLNGGIPDRDIDELSDYWNAFPHCATRFSSETDVLATAKQEFRQRRSKPPFWKMTTLRRIAVTGVQSSTSGAWRVNPSYLA